MKNNNICTNPECFGHKGNGHGSHLTVWSEYTASDGYSVHDIEDGFTIGSSIVDHGNIKRQTGNLSVWCKWCNTKIPDNKIPKELKKLFKE